MENAPSPTKPKRRWRLSMSSVLLLFVCASVSLTASVAESKSEIGLFPGWGNYKPHVQWHYALLSIATIGAIANLVRRSFLLAAAGTGRLSCAAPVAIAAALVVVLACRLLTQRGVLEMPSNHSMLLLGSDFFFDAIWYILLITALRLMVGPSSSQKPPAGVVWHMLLFAMLCVFVAKLAGEQSTITSLVLIAIGGIEAAQPQQFQRMWAFPSHASEGYFTYWMSVSGFLTLACSIGLMLLAIASRFAQRIRVLLAALASLLLGYTAWYSTWFAP